MNNDDVDDGDGFRQYFAPRQKSTRPTSEGRISHRDEALEMRVEDIASLYMGIFEEEGI